MTPRRLRPLIAALLVLGGVLFVIGTRVESSERREPTTSVDTSPSASTGESRERHEAEESAGRAGEAGTESAPAAATNAPHDEHAERLFGIDTASTVIVGLALALSIAAAVAVAFVRRRWSDLTVGVFAAVFALLDIAEAVHGLARHETGIALLAMAIAALHLSAAGLTARLYWYDRTGGTGSRASLRSGVHSGGTNGH